MEKSAKLKLDKKVGVYVPDLIVDDSVIIELKCKPVLAKSDVNQFWHYLKSSEYKLGYLVNFGSEGKAQVIRRAFMILPAFFRVNFAVNTFSRMFRGVI